MNKIDFSSYSIQKDNRKPMFLMLAVTALINVIALLINASGNTIGIVVMTDLIALSFFYSNYNRYCDNCKAKMAKDFTHGLHCENHYCEKCRRVIKMKVINARD